MLLAASQNSCGSCEGSDSFKCYTVGDAEPQRPSIDPPSVDPYDAYDLQDNSGKYQHV